MEDYGLKLVILAFEFLIAFLTLVIVKRSRPFSGTTNVELLKVARALRATGGSDGPNSLHPYEKELLYRILAKSRVVPMCQIGRALELPDPYTLIDGLRRARRFFDTPSLARLRLRPTRRVLPAGVCRGGPRPLLRSAA